jgi:hypothetical protein
MGFGTGREQQMDSRLRGNDGVGNALAARTFAARAASLAMNRN